MPSLFVRLTAALPPIPRRIRWLFWIGLLFLGVMTLLRVVTYVAFHHGAMPLERAEAAFRLGLRFDVRVVAGAMLALLLLSTLPPLNPFRGAGARRFWFPLLGVLSAVLVVFYTADFLHYAYLHERLNASALGFLRDAKIAAAMAWQTYPLVRFTLGTAAAVAFLVAGAVWLHRRAAAAAVPEPGRAGRVGWVAAGALLCAVGWFGRLGQYPLRWSDAFNLRNDASAQLALNPIQSFVSSLGFRASGFDLARVRAHYPRMRTYLGPDSNEPERLSFERRLAPTARPGVATPNVVLVLCESFSGYKSSMWGNPLDPTPFFAALCRDGVFFDQCFTPHIGTARGVWATLTGIPDVEPTKTASRNPALVDQHTIVNDFAGYEKFYFLGGSSSWANIRGLLTNNIEGLRLYEEDSYDSPRIDVWGISDKNLLLEANDVLRAQAKPFFAVIQTADNHRPYTIPREDLAPGAFTKVERSAAELGAAGFDSNAELNAFRYSDFALQQFMAAARQAPYFDHTIFVFIGDHGIGGDAGRMFPPAWTEQKLTCYHVPLLFYAPKLLRPQRLHAVASMIDVLPTIAGLAGIGYRNTGLGRDLLRQQGIDGGRSNAAFIIDHHSRSIGVIRGPYFANHQRDGGRTEIVWADFAAPAPAGAGTMPDQADYEALTEAFHETARYLLLHNKKPAAPSATHARRGHGLDERIGAPSHLTPAAGSNVRRLRSADSTTVSNPPHAAPPLSR